MTKPIEIFSWQRYVASAQRRKRAGMKRITYEKWVEETAKRLGMA